MKTTNLKLISVTSLVLLTSLQTVHAQTPETASYFDFEEMRVIYPSEQLKAPAINAEDPYEPFNRKMLDFNLAFHESVGKPMISAYRTIPSPIRTGGENFLNNLGQPLSMLNSFLQGNIEDGLNSFMRFTINTTFGLLGILDIATEAGLEDKDEDFGQTLYVWGVWPEANYVVLPFLGPTTTRDIFGKIEGAVDPIYQQQGLQATYQIDDTLNNKATIFTANGIATYNQTEPLISTLKNQIDPYIFAREAYIQNRINKIYNGKPPVQKIEDDFLFQ